MGSRAVRETGLTSTRQLAGEADNRSGNGITNENLVDTAHGLSGVPG